MLNHKFQIVFTWFSCWDGNGSGPDYLHMIIMEWEMQSAISARQIFHQNANNEANDIWRFHLFGRVLIYRHMHGMNPGTARDRDIVVFWPNRCCRWLCAPFLSLSISLLPWASFPTCLCMWMSQCVHVCVCVLVTIVIQPNDSVWHTSKMST